MSSNDYKVLSVILCDDIRNEVNGKQTLNGIYDDEIIAQSFPLLMPKLCMRIAFMIFKKNPKRLRIVLSSPQGIVAEVDGPYPALNSPATTSKTFALPFVVSPFVAAAPGNFVLKLGIDQTPRKIGEFAVRSAKNEAEKKRLQM